MNTGVLWDGAYVLKVLIREDLKVQPYADVITKATLSPQLF